MDTGAPDTASADTGSVDTASPDTGRLDSGKPEAGDAGDASDGPSGPHKHVFVSSMTYSAQFDPAGLNGLGNADMDCGDLAFTAGLGGTWVAWLSDQTMDAPSRVTDVSPWYLLDDTTLVFPDHASLSSVSGPMHAIDMDERKFPVGADSTVWTGTSSIGVASLSTCMNWSSNAAADTGTVGDASLTVSWTETGAGTDTCDQMHHIYCFEQ